MSEDSDSGTPQVNKHVALANKYVSDAWFPIDPALLARIQNNLYAGKYDNNRDRLITDLKQDTALYLFCLRRLAELASMDPDASSFARSPQLLFKDAPLPHFRDALAVQPHGVSTHHQDETKSEHAKCCEQAVVAATAAEALSKSFELDDADAYSCALLRQLGITLIAWNYPHVYNRVITGILPGQNPDELLGKMLGFSPQLLALTVAREWKLAPEILRGMGDRDSKAADLEEEEGIWHDVLMLFNPFEGDVAFQIPQFGEGGWVLELSTAEVKSDGVTITEAIDFVLAGRSIALFRRP